MTDRLDEIQARFDGFDSRGACPNCAHAAMVHGAAVADGLAVGPPPGCPEHCGPVTDADVAYLLERVRKLEADVKNWEMWADNLPSREGCW